MHIRNVTVTKNSDRIVVCGSVVGRAGEPVPCEGVDFGSFELRLHKDTSPAQAAALVRVRAAEVYLDGYTTWCYLNELSAALQETG